MQFIKVIILLISASNMVVYTYGIKVMKVIRMLCDSDSLITIYTPFNLDRSGIYNLFDIRNQ